MVRVVHDILFNSANRLPSKSAVFLKDQNMTFEDVAAQSIALARLLVSEGIQKGDRIAFFLEKRFEKVISIFGISAAGGVMVPIKRLSHPHQVSYILQNCGAKLLITTQSRLDDLAENLHEIPELQTVILVDKRENGEFSNSHIRAMNWNSVVVPAAHSQQPGIRVIENDLAAILYTSGSTGKPKGVVLSHLNIVAGAKSVAEYLKNTENDRLLSILSFGFDYGLSQLTTSFLVGAQIVLLNHLFKNDILKAVDKYQITGLAAVATTWIQLLQAKWEYPRMANLRYITNSGGAIPKDHVLELKRRLPKTSIYLMYGLTEAFRSTFLDPELVEQRPTSMGKAIPGNEVLILDNNDQPVQPGEVGELVHRGPLVARGYWGDPDLTSIRYRQDPLQPKEVPNPEFVVYSGDYVKIDADGFLYFVGRKDEMIKCAGNRVSPTEIEEVIYASRKIQDAIVFGIPDQVLGHVIRAVVVASPSVEITEEEIIQYCRRELPPYMIPAKVDIRSELPKNASGKLDRSLVKKQIMESLAVGMMNQ